MINRIRRMTCLHNIKNIVVVAIEEMPPLRGTFRLELRCMRCGRSWVKDTTTRWHGDDSRWTQ